jgi:hypothetical protein
MSMILDGSNGVTFNDASLQGAAASPYVLKNRIINGDMRIAQRGTGAVNNLATDAYQGIDRWSTYGNSADKYSTQQSTTAPTGFTNSMLITSLAATSVGTGGLYLGIQYVEGFNSADLAWGTASAKTVTLSFWVRSSLTGTFGGSILNNARDRCYIFSYTISAANTWEQKTITITGDTSGTWLTNNGRGIGLYFSFGTGSSLSGTAGSWGSSELYAPTGATSVVGTNGATFYITGVQLEQNTSATPFERRMYGQELINCQRYYYVLASLGGTTKTLGTGFYANSTRVDCPVTFKTSMRASPTLVQVSGTNFYGIYANNAVDNFNSFTDISDTSTEGTDLYAGSNVSGTSGAAGQVFSSTSGYIGFQAEI